MEPRHDSDELTESVVIASSICPRCAHPHLDYDDEACVSCGCELMSEERRKELLEEIEFDLL